MPSSIKLTIGLPHYRDFHRASFTIQSIRANNIDSDDYEIVVVDNSPRSKEGELLRTFVEKIGDKRVRYVPYESDGGPSGTKNAVFTFAAGDAVLCIDCHVILKPDAVARLIEFYDANPTTNDLFSGPILMNDLKSLHTEMAPMWRGQNWGTWYTRPGITEASEPFEIWAHGCGLFTCRRSAWLGFDERCIGFGGAEEGVIHEKFRKAGRKAICLPWLVWWHSFDRVEGVPYPLNLWDKMRNYAINFTTMDMPLDSMYAHFISMEHPNESLADHLVREHSRDRKEVDGKTDDELIAMHRSHKASQAWWDYLIADPVGHKQAPDATKVVDVTLDMVYESLAAQKDQNKDDLAFHLPKLKGIAKDMRVVEVTRRMSPCVAFLAGGATSVLTMSRGGGMNPTFLQSVQQLSGGRFSYRDAIEPVEIPECDILSLKTPHNHHGLGEELKRWAPSVSRFIAIHDTSVHADRLDDGSTGYGLQSLEFLKANPEWFVAYHEPQSWGLTILGRQPQDKPAKKLRPWGPSIGPGAEMKKMLAVLGITNSPTCDCNKKAAQMDEWGVEECRARRDEIRGWLVEGAPRWSWTDKVAAAAKAVTSGLAFSLSITDPYGSLVDEAIRRADEAEKADVA